VPRWGEMGAEMGASRLDKRVFSQTRPAPQASPISCLSSPPRGGLRTRKGHLRERNTTAVSGNCHQIVRPGYTSPFLSRRGQSVESLPKALGGRLEGLKQVEKLVHGHSGAANQRPQGAQREFLVLGNREVDPYARLDQHEMAADLTDGFPSGALEGSGRLLPGNVPQSPHALDGHHDRWDSFTVRQSGDGFLVFGP